MTKSNMSSLNMHLIWRRTGNKRCSRAFICRSTVPLFSPFNLFNCLPGWLCRSWSYISSPLSPSPFPFHSCSSLFCVVFFFLSLVCIYTLFFFLLFIKCLWVVASGVVYFPPFVIMPSYIWCFAVAFLCFVCLFVTVSIQFQCSTFQVWCVCSLFW